MPVPSITILKFLRSASNYYGWPSLNVDILILYVSYISDVGFLHVFTLMACIARSFSNSNLMNGIGEGSMRACVSLLSHGPFSIGGCLGIFERSVVTTHVVTLKSTVRVS